MGVSADAVLRSRRILSQTSSGNGNNLWMTVSLAVAGGFVVLLGGVYAFIVGRRHYFLFLHRRLIQKERAKKRAMLNKLVGTEGTVATSEWSFDTVAVYDESFDLWIDLEKGRRPTSPRISANTSRSKDRNVDNGVDGCKDQNVDNGVSQNRRDVKPADEPSASVIAYSDTQKLDEYVPPLKVASVKSDHLNIIATPDLSPFSRIIRSESAAWSQLPEAMGKGDYMTGNVVHSTDDD